MGGRLSLQVRWGMRFFVMSLHPITAHMLRPEGVCKPSRQRCTQGITGNKLRGAGEGCNPHYTALVM